MLPRVPLDPSQVGSPDAWLTRLAASLDKKRDHHERMRAYARGEADLPEIANPAVRSAFALFQQRCRTNFAGLAVETMLDCMHEAAFRLGADGDALGDRLAWDMWQANGLDADMPALRRDVFVTGEAFAMVGAPDPVTGIPVATVEDPANIAAAHDPLRRRRLRAALKVWVDPWMGTDHAKLTLRGDLLGEGAPTTVWTAERTSSQLKGASPEWQWVGDPKPLPFAHMPIIWYPNLLATDGVTTCGEFEQHIDVLNRINTTVLQRLVIAAMQAFRQRVLEGLPMFEQDINGNPIMDPTTGQPKLIDYDQIFAADPAAIWQVPAGVKVTELATTDITPLLTAARDDVRDFAAVTRTPLPALAPDAANQSGANTELVESGLVHKVVDRMTVISESHEDLLRVMFAWKKDNRAKLPDIETLWLPPQLPTFAERYDAASKAIAAGVPRDWVMLNIVGMSPQELARAARTAIPVPQAPVDLAAA